MESEILCGDSLIISDKMQQEKEDGNVAQKIQAECDKKFNDSDVINEAEPLVQSKPAEAEAEEKDDSPVEHVTNGNGVESALQNGNHHEEPEEDSLNVINVDNNESKVEIIETLEKTQPEVEIHEEIEEPKIVIEEKHQPEVADVDDINIHRNVTDEVKIQNGDNDNDNDNKEEEKQEEEKEEIKIDDEPVKSHYQPEKIENFGISVKEMVNDMPRVIEDEMKAPKESVPNGPRKGAIATSMDTESVRDAYNEIRDNNTDTTWAVFKYEASRIVCAAKGVAFDEFKKLFDDDERAYGYIRLQTGDELSKRSKFLFVTWIGPGVSVLKRAKMSIDKAIIKNVVSNFAVELQLETLSEFDLPFFTESLNKASGANYGTGVREI